MWNRWIVEYLRVLRECYRFKFGDKWCFFVVGDVVIIKLFEWNRNSWLFGIVESLIKGRDGVARGVRLRVGRFYIECFI